MTSLISSIFGEKIQGSSSSDLFAKAITEIKPMKATAPKERKKTSEKDEGPDKNDIDIKSTKETNEPAEESSADKEKREEEEKRTIFVGNLPVGITRRGLASIFKSCGEVQSSRLRSVAVAGVKLPPEQAGNQKLMRQVCANTGKLLADAPKKCAQGYVVFKSLESVKKALQLNNTTYQSHTIRVDFASPTIEPDHSVFVGNLPYGADEETLREHFAEKLNEGDLNEDEGAAISGVRIIRDNETQKCKGFGYVTLRDAALVPIALLLNESTYMKRELRVMVCGKRCKGKRGKESKTNLSGRRSFEGQRATTSSKTNSFSKKRKVEDDSSPHGSSVGKVKKRRARSEKKNPPGSVGKAGASKRAAAEQKVNKRVKKLQKRAQKGMGKKKK
jgi:nucleolar protein 12